MVPTRKFSGVLKKPKTLENNPIGLNSKNSKNTENFENSVLVSILIPTHNRDIFETLKSIAAVEIPFKYEVLINDDSKTYSKKKIQEYAKKFRLPLRLLRATCYDITGIYKSLLREAKGEYLYYLEDDDFLMAPFVQALKTMVEKGIDLMYCNYFGYENPVLEFNKTTVYTGSCEYKTKITPSRRIEPSPIEYTVNSGFVKFFESYNHYDKFQLGRIIFKKSICKLFPRKNNVLNDWHLFRHLRPEVFATSEYIIYKQNVNGDNISFEVKKPFFKDEFARMVDLSLPYYRKINKPNTGHPPKGYPKILLR